MDELHVDFCDLCNSSIPDSDLERGAARRFEGKVIGSCCLSRLAPAAHATPKQAAGAASAAASGGSGGGGWFASAFVVLIAVAGATLFLDWRFGEEASRLADQVRGLEGEIDPLAEKLVGLEKSLGSGLRSEDLDVVQSSVTGLGSEMTATEERVLQSIRDNATRLRELATRFSALDSGQRDHLARIAEVHADLRRVAQRIEDVSSAAAMPAVPALVGEGAADSAVGGGEMIDDGGAAPAEGSAGLPAHLVRFVGKLQDPDDGERFEAVDELLQSADPRVFEYVLPLATDPDPFVRRLVFEGIKEHRSDASVDALVTALGDSESLVRYTAHASLKALTGQDFPFDPDAAPAKRSSMQRRWSEWWDKNRDRMF